LTRYCEGWIKREEKMGRNKSRNGKKTEKKTGGYGKK